MTVSGTMSRDVPHVTPGLRIAALLSVAAVLITGCERQDAADIGETSYVGARTCAECHKVQFGVWQGSHHALAMQVAGDKSVLGDFDEATFRRGGVASRFFRRNGKFMVRTEGADGNLADFEIKYTFGVTPLQQYLIELSGGRLQALTIAWDSRPKEAGGQRWFDLYPDQHIAHDDPLHWTGMNQNWNYMCADCHSTNLLRNYDPGTDRFSTTWSDINVACESCHGPGSRHVAWARKGKSWFGRRAQDNGLAVRFEDNDEWITDPGKDTAHRSVPRGAQSELEVCAPCHARRTQIADRHLPGRPVLDSYLVSLLDPDLYAADGQMEEEVYNYAPFLQSRMHARGVSCGDCHEPHSQKLRAEGNGVCTRCHARSRYDSAGHHHHPEDSEGAYCKSCHMPVRTYMIVDPRHDHSFRVPRPDASVSLGTPNACNDCHKDRPAAWAADAVERWYGPDRKGLQSNGPAFTAARTGRLDAPRLLRQLAADPGQPAITRATAYAELARYFSPSYASVLRRGLTDADPLVRLGALRGLDAVALEERWPLAGHLLKDPVRGIRIEAASFLAGVPLDDLGKDDRALLQDTLKEYVDVQMFNASRPEARLSLGLLYAQRGDAQKAEAEYRAAIALDHGFIPAYVNLADLYRTQGRDEEGGRVLRDALALAPDDASVQHALGLLLVRAQRLDEALPWLERAAVNAPGNARYAYVYGIALSSAGRLNKALDVLATAQRRHAADRDLLYALITMNRDAGRMAEAHGYAEQLTELAPDDPLVTGAMNDLGGP